MPELPEVTTIVNQLQKEIVGHTIAEVVSVDGYKTTPEFKEFREKVVGQKVLDVRRIAKNIVVELKKKTSSEKKSSSKDYIVIHLAMTGRLLLRQIGQKEDPWARLVFKLKGESGKWNELRFCDSRMFGFVRLMDQDELEEYAGKYGPDALDKNLTPEVFLNQLKKKRTEVKRALLEQELVAGVGNIYVNDSLWMAKIHPETSTQDVTAVQGTSLLSGLQQILREAIGHRGSTLGDKMYVDVYGQEGEHQNYFRVFGKDGQPCPRCSDIINYSEIGGRGTFFCPKCQKKSGDEKQVALL